MKLCETFTNSEARAAVPCEMDYYGQKLAEDLGHAIIIAGFAIGTIVGFWKQSLLIAIYGWAAGLVLAILLCVPSWPWYRRNPVKWQAKTDSHTKTE